MGIKTRKVVIIGVGYVGSHVASSLMLRSVADEIVLIDIDEKRLMPMLSIYTMP